MRKVFIGILILILWVQSAFGAEPILLARMNPYVAGVGASACSDTEKDTSGTTTTEKVCNISNGEYIHCAVKFTAGSPNHSVTKIQTRIKKVGAPASLTFYLTEDNSGKPQTNAHAGSISSNTLTAGDVTTDFTTYTLTLTTAKTLTATTPYWIKATASNIGDTSNYYIIERDGADSSGGGVSRSADDNTWITLDSDGDLYWRTINCE